MVACGYGIILLMFNLTSHSFAVLSHELLSQTLEEKFHIYMHPCIILYSLVSFIWYTNLWLGNKWLGSRQYGAIRERETFMVENEN